MLKKIAKYNFKTNSAIDITELIGTEEVILWKDSESNLYSFSFYDKKVFAETNILETKQITLDLAPAKALEYFSEALRKYIDTEIYQVIHALEAQDSNFLDYEEEGTIIDRNNLYIYKEYIKASVTIEVKYIEIYLETELSESTIPLSNSIEKRIISDSRKGIKGAIPSLQLFRLMLDYAKEREFYWDKLAEWTKNSEKNLNNTAELFNGNAIENRFLKIYAKEEFFNAKLYLSGL